MRSKKRRFLNKKKNAQNVHFKKRMIQRYRIFFNKNQKKEMISQIKRGTAKFLYKESNTKSIWSIQFRGRNIPVVYDNIRKNLVTCLDWDMVKENMKNL